MNAILMAAGNGMRLRPITDNIQKCLLPVSGKPMLEWWLDAAFRSGRFERVFVNIHYMWDDVLLWIESYEKRKNCPIEVIDESEKLLGTAGTLREEAEQGEEFMMAYTDTYSAQLLENLKFYIDLWKGQSEDFMAGLISFNPPNDGSASAITLDSIGRVLNFKEKANKGDVSWMGTMFARPDFLWKIRESDRDLAHDVFPRMANEMRVIAHVEAYDIGRGIEHYERIKNSLSKQR